MILSEFTSFLDVAHPVVGSDTSDYSANIVAL